MINYHENFSLENLFYINEKGLVCSEEFRDIPGYEGLYQVSNLGRVKSLNYKRTKEQKILKTTNNGSGYLKLSIYKNRIPYQITVHQLSAMAFYGHVPCGYKKVVDHKNQIRFGNNIDNLRIVTVRENTNQKHLPSTSQYTGVFWHKTKGKWGSSIYLNGKKKHLGYFENESEAYKYYENALIAIEKGDVIIVKIKNKTSKHKGIHWNNERNKWITKIKIDQKIKFLGSFDTEEDAYSAYLKAALQ